MTVTSTLKIFLPFVLMLGGAMNMVTLNAAGNIANANLVLKRVDGQYAAMSTGLDGGGGCLTFAVDAFGHVYVGGKFTTAGGAAANSVVVYNQATDAFTTMGNGLTGSGITANKLLVGPDGKVYAFGSYTTAGAVAAANAGVWDGANWAAMGAGLTGGVSPTAYDAAWGPDNKLYVVGMFTTAGTSAGSGVARWTGAAWEAVGAGLTGGAAVGYGIIAGSDGMMYVVGDFTTAGGVACANICKINPNTGVYSTVGSGLDARADKIRQAQSGLYYVTGRFSTAGGVPASRIAAWNGSSYTALGSGLTGGYGYCLEFDENGLLLVGGDFTAAGGMTLADHVAVWNGTIWQGVDIDFPGSALVAAITRFSNQMYFGFDTTGTAVTSGLSGTSVSNPGSAKAYPQIVIKRVGGTSAKLESIQNLTTGEKLLFDLPLADGEQVTITCAPGMKSVVSTFSGSVIGKMLTSSNFATFGLAPGVNNIALYVSSAGSPTITAYMQWPTMSRTVDG